MDEAYNGDHLLIFMTHVWAAEHDDVQQGYLRAVIEYAQSLGMPIGTMQEGYERYGNMLEVEEQRLGMSLSMYLTISSKI